MFFEQGAFRYCYKGAIKNLKRDSIITIDFPLGQCVVKIYKKQFFTQDYLLISLVQNMHMKKQKNLIE